MYAALNNGLHLVTTILEGQGVRSPDESARESRKVGAKKATEVEFSGQVELGNIAKTIYQHLILFFFFFGNTKTPRARGGAIKESIVLIGEGWRGLKG